MRCRELAGANPNTSQLPPDLLRKDHCPAFPLLCFALLYSPSLPFAIQALTKKDALRLLPDTCFVLLIPISWSHNGPRATSWKDGVENDTTAFLQIYLHVLLYLATEQLQIHSLNSISSTGNQINHQIIIGRQGGTEYYCVNGRTPCFQLHQGFGPGISAAPRFGEVVREAKGSLPHVGGGHTMSLSIIAGPADAHDPRRCLKCVTGGSKPRDPFQLVSTSQVQHAK